MRGGDLGYGEENVLQRQMRQRGHVIGYDPLLIIEHFVPLRKQQLAWFRDRQIAQGRSYFLEHSPPATLTASLALLLSLFVINVRNLSRAGWRLACGSYRLQNVYIDTVPPLLFQREVLRALLTNRKTDRYRSRHSKTCR
jgi:hypothetical protein